MSKWKGESTFNVRSIFGRRRCECLQHNNTCPGDGGGSSGVESGGWEDHMVTIVAIDQHHGCRGLHPDGRTYIGGFRLGVRLFFYRRCTCRRWPRVFCIRELHDPRLWRYYPGRAMATTWPDYSNEWRAAIRLVNRCNFRGAAEGSGTQFQRGATSIIGWPC